MQSINVRELAHGDILYVKEGFHPLYALYDNTNLTNTQKLELPAGTRFFVFENYSSDATVPYSVSFLVNPVTVAWLANTFSQERDLVIALTEYEITQYLSSDFVETDNSEVDSSILLQGGIVCPELNAYYYVEKIEGGKWRSSLTIPSHSFQPWWTISIFTVFNDVYRHSIVDNNDSPYWWMWAVNYAQCIIGPLKWIDVTHMETRVFRDFNIALDYIFQPDDRADEYTFPLLSIGMTTGIRDEDWQIVSDELDLAFSKIEEAGVLSNDPFRDYRIETWTKNHRHHMSNVSIDLQTEDTGMIKDINLDFDSKVISIELSDRPSETYIKSFDEDVE